MLCSKCHALKGIPIQYQACEKNCENAARHVHQHVRISSSVLKIRLMDIDPRSTYPRLGLFENFASAVYGTSI